MELEKYVHKHEKILISITLGAEKSISPHPVWFSNTIDVAVRDAFPVQCLKFADVLLEYFKIVKGALQISLLVFILTYIYTKT